MEQRPAREEIISKIGQLALNKYAQASVLGAATFIVGYKAYKTIQAFRDEHSYNGKPIMKTVNMQRDGENVVVYGVVQKEQVQATKTVTQEIDGELKTEEQPIFERLSEFTVRGAIRQNWKLPTLAVAGLVATVARIII